MKFISLWYSKDDTFLKQIFTIKWKTAQYLGQYIIDRNLVGGKK